MMGTPTARQLRLYTHEAFDRLGDNAPPSEVVDDVKRHLAAKRIDYQAIDPYTFTATYDNCRVIRSKRNAKQPVTQAVTVTPPTTTTRRQDAADRARHERFMQELQRRIPGIVKAMPTAKPLTLRQAEHLKAVTLVAEAIDEQLDHCHALEREEP